MSIFDTIGVSAGAFTAAKKLGSAILFVAGGVLLGFMLKGCIEGEKIAKNAPPRVTQRIDTLYLTRWYPFVIREKNVPGTNITDSTFDIAIDTVSSEGDTVRINLTADKKYDRLKLFEFYTMLSKPITNIFVTRDCTHTEYIPTETTVLIDNQWVLIAGTAFGVIFSLVVMALF